MEFQIEDAEIGVGVAGNNVALLSVQSAKRDSIILKEGVEMGLFTKQDISLRHRVTECT
jgi:hypothetical protein